MGVKVRVAIAVVAVVAILSLPLAVSGQPEAPGSEWVLVDVDPPKPITRASTKISRTFVPPPAKPAASIQSATFNVTLVGVPSPAVPAIDEAVALMAAQIESPVPIHVVVTWENLDPGVLGGGFPNAYALNTANNYFYAVALANSLAGFDLDPGEPDIIVRLSSNINWYLGTDGQTPVDKYDLLTLVHHELAHGLGYFPSFVVLDGLGYWLGPFIYDGWLVNFNFDYLIEEEWGSVALKNELTSNGVFWLGPNGTSANNNFLPRLWAPTTWDQGGSIGHLDEFAFPPGDPNSIMTPFQDFGEADHNLGPVGRGMLEDIGWVIIDPPPPPTPTATPTATPVPIPVPKTAYLPALMRNSAATTAIR